MPSRTLLVAVLAAMPTGIAAADESRLTFYADILPILQQNCQECHREAGANYGGMVAPMSLTTYNETRPWAKSIRENVLSGEMPPWDADEKFHGVFRNERSLTQDEIDRIVRWVETGAPRGNPAEAPESPEFDSVDGWVIGEPDLVVTMPEPFLVGDDIYDLYTAFEVDLTDEMLPEDAWITAFQCKPDSDIIHHFNCHLLEPTDGKLPPKRESPVSEAIAPVGAGQYIGGVSSGTGANRFPEGFGLPLKKGTRVTFDIHYHKEPGPGTGATDQSSIGFKLTRTEPSRTIGGVPPILRFDIDIPPRAKEHVIGPGSITLTQSADVIALMPHMHMRGSRATFEAFYPDGTHEVLLHVPTYDFSWQTVYYYNELKRLPKDTRVQFTAWYDNSPEMAAERGFDPDQRVRYGQKSTDEMMMGFLLASPVPTEN